MDTAQSLITHLGLSQHPEGGYYKEVYRSEGEINAQSLGDPYQGNRNYATSIYFLLTSNAFSAFHKINQDEIWHFYQGSGIRIHSIAPTGKYTKTQLGHNFVKGETPQHIVPGGHWFAAEVIEKNSYGLVGCTVAPGFDFNDFQLAKRTDLIALFPEHKKEIIALTR